MKTFVLSCRVTVSARTEVRAECLEDAIHVARRRDVVLGGTGSGEDAEESWIIEDADGLPQNIEVDE